jgi:hypothetical protein
MHMGEKTGRPVLGAIKKENKAKIQTKPPDFPKVDGGYLFEVKISNIHTFDEKEMNGGFVASEHKFNGHVFFRASTCTFDHLGMDGSIVLGDEDVIIMHYIHTSHNTDIFGSKSYPTNSFFTIRGGFRQVMEIPTFKKHVATHLAVYLQTHNAQLPKGFWRKDGEPLNKVYVKVGSMTKSKGHHSWDSPCVYQLTLPKTALMVPQKPVSTLDQFMSKR